MTLGKAVALIVLAIVLSSAVTYTLATTRAAALEERLSATEKQAAQIDAATAKLDQRLAAAEKQTTQLQSFVQQSVDAAEARAATADAAARGAAQAREKDTAAFEKRLAALDERLQSAAAQAREKDAAALEKRLSALDERLQSAAAQAARADDSATKLTAAASKDPLKDLAVLEARLSVLENRLAAAEAHAFKVIPPALIDPAEEARLKTLSLNRLRAEFVRQNLALQVCERTVSSAKLFLALCEAREQAGQVTRLDVSTADAMLRGVEFSLIATTRLRDEAAADLQELIGADGVKAVAIPTSFLPAFNAEAVDARRAKNLSPIEIRADPTSRKVVLAEVDSGNKVISATSIYQATPVDETALKKAIANAPLESQARYQRSLESAMRLLRTCEQEIYLRGAQIESARRSVEAAHISFERGLQSSFDVTRADDTLLAAQLDFINRVQDYDIHRAQLDYLLARGQ